jgi:mono/diheme cytochrome c family protein
MTPFRAALLALLVPLFGGCGEPAPEREWTPADHGQPAGPDPDGLRDEPAQAAPTGDPLARAAAALWNASCAGCHGRQGRGDGAERPPAAQMPDLTAQEFQTRRSDEQLAQVIRDGRGMMPGFGKQLNTNGVDALVAHIRKLGAAAGDAEANAGSGQNSAPPAGEPDTAAPGDAAQNQAPPPPNPTAPR